MTLVDTLFGVVAVFLLLLLWRNTRVYRFRNELLWADWDRFQQLPSYDAMMWRFWVWPLRRFLPKES